MHPSTTKGQLRNARERFQALLQNRDTSEKLWQGLFADCPFILSESLPLRLLPSDIHPLARPGRSEPDFMFFARESAMPVFGSIEIKRADSPILTLPRKQIITLSRTASTALQQAREYTRQKQPIVSLHDTLFVGGATFVFVIMGLSDEIITKVTSAVLEEQFRRLVPRGCQILPYDTLLRLFERATPPRVILLVPATYKESSPGGSGFCGL